MLTRCASAVSQRDAGDDSSKASLLAIAHYNKGVELEHLKRMAEAVKTYKTALKYALEDLGRDHAMTKGIKNTLAAAKRAASKAKGKKSSGRRRKK